MKKLLALILAIIMTFSFAGCGKTIKLTNENYETYLKFRVGEYVDNHHFLTSASRHNIQGYPDVFGVYEKCTLTVFSEGTSQNFNYNDVKIKVRITVEYLKIGDKDADYTREHYIDPIVEGYETKTYVVELDTDISGYCKSDEIQLDLGEYYSHFDMISSEIEILEISGTVTPA